MNELKKKYVVKSSHNSACRQLGGSVTAGLLLYRMCVRSRNGALKDEHGEKGWIALTKNEWMIEAGLTRHEFDNALKLLKDRDLIKYRRRKLSYKDKNARSWYKVLGNTKSAIADITSGKIQSVYSENIDVAKSADTNIEAADIPANADTLNNMLLKKNDIKENVVIEETTTKTKDYNFKKKSNKKEDRYNNYIDKIFKGSMCSKPELKKSNIDALSKISNYIRENKKIFCCKDYLKKDVTVNVLQDIIQYWREFIYCAEKHNKAYNIPNQPQFWFLEKQVGFIPDFLNYLWYLKEIDEMSNFKLYFDDYKDFIKKYEEDNTLKPVPLLSLFKHKKNHSTFK